MTAARTRFVGAWRATDVYAAAMLAVNIAIARLLVRYTATFAPSAWWLLPDGVAVSDPACGDEGGAASGDADYSSTDIAVFNSPNTSRAYSTRVRGSAEDVQRSNAP